MDNFQNVTIIKKANVYFDGKVTSRTIMFDSGEKKTLGIILPGEYEFKTNDKETMEILEGKMKVLLPNSTKWKEYKIGEFVEVPANSSFKLRISEVTDYCCSFEKA